MPDLYIANFDCLALDFDGTIADTRQAHTDARLLAFETLAEQIGDERLVQIPPGIHEIAHHYGHRSVEIIGWVLKEAGITPELESDTARELARLKTEIYWDVARQGLPAIDGAAEFVRAAAPQVGKLAIVTTAWKEIEVDPYLVRHGLSGIIDEHLIVTQDETGEVTKPHPRPYLKLRARLGAPIGRILAVEDNARGIESAKTARERVIALVGTHTPEEISKFPSVQSPDAIANDYRHLSKILGMS